MKTWSPLVLLLTCALLFLPACSYTTAGRTTQTARAAAVTAAAYTKTPSHTSTFSASLTPTITLTPTVTLTPTKTAVPLPAFKWHIETIDSGKKGMYTTLAVDSNDIPHIAYLDDSEDDLRYATLDQTGWAIEAFESPNVDGFYPSIVIDNQGRPQITRWIMGVRWLAYMPWTKEQDWVVTAFLPNLRVASTSLALDHAKKQVPYIVFYDLDAAAVRFARYRVSGWVVQTIDETTEESVYFPLVLDSMDLPHVVYYHAQDGLKLAIQNEDGKTWDTQVVEAGVGVGMFPSLILDPQGNAHISYYDANHKNLKYAHQQNGKWEVQVVDDSGNVGGYTSIAINSQGIVQISYYDETNSALMLAVGNDELWQLSIVDEDGDVGKYNSLALDSQGNPHISYYDRTNRSLKYASASSDSSPHKY